ncbi:hypothetical protein SDC9_164836 [bioreactor metagenome]|uniref:Uncharacterized protein n=1 Tax=bioreactor metagenome TaxID=1076179 RepID=A0A645FZZ2_9ZZZZ
MHVRSVTLAGFLEEKSRLGADFILSVAGKSAAVDGANGFQNRRVRAGAVIIAEIIQQISRPFLFLNGQTL